jgi:hypothetical protein
MASEGVTSNDTTSNVAAGVLGGAPHAKEDIINADVKIIVLMVLSKTCLPSINMYLLLFFKKR